MTEIIYSASEVAKIREKDPDFQKIIGLWEQAFNSQVTASMEDGHLVIRERTNVIDNNPK